MHDGTAAPHLDLLATARFHAVRRLPWTVEALRSHVDEVVDRLRAVPGAEEVGVDVDLERGVVDLVLVFGAPDGIDAERTFREELGRAIRASGAMHRDLLAAAEESRLKATVDGPWSGLRLPTWQLHRLRVEPVA